MQPPKTPSALPIVFIVLLLYGVIAVMILLLSSLIGFWLNGSEGASFALGIGMMMNLLAFPAAMYILVARLRGISDTARTPKAAGSNEKSDEERSA